MTNEPLFEITFNKRYKARLYPDRIEREMERKVSAGKVTAGILTYGLSLAATGVKSGKEAFESTPLSHITNVTIARVGFDRQVELHTASGEAITFRLDKATAEEFRQAVVGAMQALHTPSPVYVQTAEPSAPVAPQPDLADQLQKLASLRDAGILTEEEFSAKKGDLLSRM